MGEILEIKWTLKKIWPLIMLPHGCDGPSRVDQWLLKQSASGSPWGILLICRFWVWPEVKFCGLPKLSMLLIYFEEGEDKRYC